jgi:phage terminase large subunit GpA-like protein
MAPSIARQCICAANVTRGANRNFRCDGQPATLYVSQQLMPAWPTPEEIITGASFPAGSVHLPSWADSEWLKQLTAEQLVTVKNKRGFSKLEWQKLRERNEALDCRVYARAAAWIAGADRWSDARWQELERQIAVELTTPVGDVPTKSTPRPSARRRTMRSPYMG